MATMIRGILKRSWNRTFLTSFILILAVEVLTFIVAWFSLGLNTNRWIDDKTAHVMQISQETASNNDWSQIDTIPIKGTSPTFERYHRKLVDLSHQYFQKVGSVYLVRIVHGEEFDVDIGDSIFSDGGKPDEWERRAYSTRKPTFTPVPYSDESGTDLEAYTPILREGKVIGLVGAENDSAPLSDFQGIVRSVFLLSMLPAILFSVLISCILASRFAEPIEVLRDIEDVKKKGLGQIDSGAVPWGLSESELRVFEQLIDDPTNAQIAARLFKDPETVKTQMTSIRRKSGLKRWELIVAAREWLTQTGSSAESA